MGKKAVSIETSISHTKAVKLNDVLTATAKLKNKTRSLAVFNVDVTNQKEELVAIFKGTVFLKEEWLD
jgi:acyl-CoA thioesterase